MLKFSMGTVKPVPFQLESDDGTVDLFFTPMTVADSMRLGEIQGKYVGNKELSDSDRTECLLLAEIVSTVKTADGSYYWSDDIEELRGVFTGEMFFGLVTQCKLVNPSVAEGEDLATKKK